MWHAAAESSSAAAGSGLTWSGDGMHYVEHYVERYVEHYVLHYVEHSVEHTA